MSRPTSRDFVRALGVMIALCLAVFVERGHGQDVAPPPPPKDNFAQSLEDRLAEAEEPAAVATDEPNLSTDQAKPFSTVSLAPEGDLLERLQQAENRIRLLEVNQSVMIDPKSGSQGPQGKFFQTMSSQWLNAGNPEVAIINAQTFQQGNPSASERAWYERLAIRGYSQIRFDDVPHVAAGSAPPNYVEDSAIDEYQNFFIRRARLIFFGDITDHMFAYVQGDFAATPPNTSNAIDFAQLRDCYADVYIDVDKVHRWRIGQSKVPYGWENMQSSSNRIPLDRDDALNSAMRNQRDLGVFYYWTPERGQDTLMEIMDADLRGSGNYGIFAFGTYNGQGGSVFEENDNLHIVSRLTLPWKWESGQFTEVSVQGYTGKFVVPSAAIDPLGVAPPIIPANTQGTDDHIGQRDERVALTGIYYPQPWGFQTEWNVGRGPALNTSQTAVVERSLTGGYAMGMYKYDSSRWGTFFPFVRYQYFKGGFKYLPNAPYMNVNEWNMGVEWELNPQMQLTPQYTFSNRTNTDAVAETGVMPYQQFVGSLFRVQFQLNY